MNERNEEFNKTAQSKFFNQKTVKGQIPIRSIIYKKILPSEEKKAQYLNEYKFPTLASSMQLI